MKKITSFFLIFFPVFVLANELDKKIDPIAAQNLDQKMEQVPHTKIEEKKAEVKNIESPTFTVQAQKRSKTRLLLGIVGQISQETKDIIDVIKKDLEFTGQFDVAIRAFEQLSAKNDVEMLAKENYSLAVFFNDVKKSTDIEWRVYYTNESSMLKGSKYARRGNCMRGWAHNIADSVWQVLTNQEGFFSTKIAYCKDIHQPRKRKVTHVVVADYDGSNEQVLVAHATVNVAPRWNNDIQNPLVFYSEYTNSNVRLIAVNMDKKRKVASNYDGVNMCASFAPDGKHVIYCASKGKGTCQLYYYEKGNLKKLTDNNGNNVSPTFSEDGKKIFFCSDYQTGQPQIYCFDIDKNELKRITDSGYCASPNYCSKNHCLAYSKIIQGVMQLFVYDTVKDEHRQLTTDAGHKEECSWSPCGNWLLFSVEHKNKSRIAMLNVPSNERKYLTSAKNVCSYPAWSPVYEKFPTVA